MKLSAKAEEAMNRTVKMTKKDLTRAIARYARKYGYYARTVRTVTALRLTAIAEWQSHISERPLFQSENRTEEEK